MSAENQTTVIARRSPGAPVATKKAFANKFKRRDDIVAKVEFKNGIFFELTFLPRPQLQKLYSEAQVMRMNTVTEVREPQTDPDVFAQNFTARVVRGWDGLTARKLADLIDIDLAGMSDEEKDTPIPYDPEEMADLFREAYAIDSFIQDFVTNLKNFRPDHEHETKNLEGSPNGS